MHLPQFTPFCWFSFQFLFSVNHLNSVGEFRKLSMIIFAKINTNE